MESLISNLVNFFLLSSAMVIVALMIRAVMQNKLNISIMMMIWMAVLIRMIVPFTLNAPIHISDFIESEPEIIESSDALSVNRETSTTVLAESNTNNIAINQTQTASTQPITQNETVEVEAESKPNTLVQFFKALNYKKIALWAWAIGVFVAFVTHMTKLLMFRSKIMPYMRRINQTDILFKNQKRIGLFKMVSLYECACIDMPMTMGLFAPKIIIPRGLVSKISSEKLDMILTHELCHIKRYDLLKAYLWLAAKSLHWFNPFVYMAYNAYLEDMESLCDKTVISYFDDEKAEAIYSQALVDVIKLAKFSDEPYALISFCKDKTKLRKRVIQMIDPNKKSKLVGVISVVLIMIAMVGCFTTACFKGEEEVVIDESEIKIVEANAEPVVVENVEANEVEVKVVDKKIESKEEAVSIAEAINITNAENFTYLKFTETTLPYHIVDTNDKTTYYIYDFNGQVMGVSVFFEEIACESEISHEEAINKVNMLVKKIYSGYEIMEIDLKDNNDEGYFISGIMFSESENRSREFNLGLKKDGTLLDISAYYDPMDVLDISQEVIDNALYYLKIEREDLDFRGAQELFGLNTFHFSTEKNETHVTLNQSDGALVNISFFSVEDEEADKFDMEKDQISHLLDGFVDQYFSNVQSVDVGTYEVNGGMCYTSGTLIKDDGVEYKLNSRIRSDGKLIDLEIEPIIDYSDSKEISKEQAEEKARDMIFEDCPFAEEDLKLIKDYPLEDGKMPFVHMFEFEYKSNNPSIRDYSFKGLAGVDMFTGDFATMRIDPITDGMDLISKEEAIKIAKEYAGNQVDPQTNEPIDINKLTYKEDFYMTGPILIYQINFDYEGGDHGYLCTMTPDDGVVDAFGY